MLPLLNQFGSMPSLTLIGVKFVFLLFLILSILPIGYGIECYYSAKGLILVFSVLIGIKCCRKLQIYWNGVQKIHSPYHLRYSPPPEMCPGFWLGGQLGKNLFFYRIWPKMLKNFRFWVACPRPPTAP
jgi:hypothetical protein